MTSPGPVTLLATLGLWVAPACSIYDSDDTPDAGAASADSGGPPPATDCSTLPAWDAERTCWKLVDCLAGVPFRECWSPVCLDDAPEASVALMDELFTCLGERCSGLSAEEFSRCQGEQCNAQLLSCAADSDPDSCWGLEACILRDCVEGAGQDCYDACLDGASDACKDCLADADSAFVRAHCSDQVLTFERCTALHECLQYECAQEHCRRELEGIRTCRDAALESAPEDYRERVEPCYPPPE